MCHREIVSLLIRLSWKLNESMRHDHNEWATEIDKGYGTTLKLMPKTFIGIIG